MTRIYCCLVLCCSCCRYLGDTVARAEPNKKFIQLGWDIPSTTQLREHWQQMEETTPFDGVMFRLEVQDDQGGRSAVSRSGMPNRGERDG
jgi:hypothetical protein